MNVSPTTKLPPSWLHAFSKNENIFAYGMEEISKRNILEQKQFFRSVFREIISEWRTEQKISQELFAKQCKLSRPRISDWKKLAILTKKEIAPKNI